MNLSDGPHCHNKCTHVTMEEVQEDSVFEVVHPRSNKTDERPNGIGVERLETKQVLWQGVRLCCGGVRL